MTVARLLALTALLAGADGARSVRRAKTLFQSRTSLAKEGDSGISNASEKEVPNLQDISARRDSGSKSGSRHAIVSLFYGGSSKTILTLRTTMSSARRHGSTADRLVMVPYGDESALAWRGLLESEGVQIVEVPGLEMPQGMAQGMAPKDKIRWSKIFTKLMAFNLTTYDKVLLIDSDAYFAGSGSPDQIFDDCGSHELCLVEDATADMWIEEDCPDDPSLCRQLNTGVMVLRPSAERLEDVWREAEKDHRTYHLPDQQFLSRYLRSHEESLDWKLLSTYWNCCIHKSPADPDSRPWIGHFCGGDWVNGWSAYTSKLCIDDPDCPPQRRLWQIEAVAADPCLGQQTSDRCSTSEACNWCGTHCMDKRLDCSGITFSEDAAAPP